MSFPQYPEYKDSGVEWLGEVPAHWELKKIAWHVPYTVGWTPSSGNEEYYDGDNLWVTIADLNKPVIYDTKSKISDKAISDRGGRLSPVGSMLFSFKLTVGNVSFLAKPAYTNEAIASFEPNKNVDLNYWAYAAPQFIPKYGRENIYGALLLNQELIGAVRFHAPHMQEQKRISRFLDHETARIDALIDEQKRLIELLKEKRQAVISHAVTKGLDPDVPMKESGVEWLGEVPAHWGMTCIKHCCYINDGNHGEEYPKAGDFTEDESGVPFIRGGNLKNLTIDTAGMLCITQEKNLSMRKGQLRSGDILFVNRGEIGKLAVVPKNMEGANLNSQIAYLRVNNRQVTPGFLVLYLSSNTIKRHIEAAKEGSVLTQYPISDLASIKFPVPPKAEQEKIVSYLDEENSFIDSLELEAYKNTALLQERRSALISAAVTGKIYVRDWQPPEGSTAPSEAP